jgi:cell division protein ZapA (FtsZ GTPase activity inhibitor)
VRDLAGYISERAEEIGKNTAVISTLDIAVLTLLNITDELFQERLDRRVTDDELEESAREGEQATDRAVNR